MGKKFWLSICLWVVVSCSVILFSATSICAYGIVPDDLNEGDLYRMVFVTEGTTGATSSNYLYYTQFVNEQAILPGSFFQDLDTTWKAIVSTHNVAAEPYIRSDVMSVPVYMANSLTVSPVRIADSSQEMFSQTPNYPINYNQFGQIENTNVWTGSYSGGDPVQGKSAGSKTVIYGYSHLDNSLWINGPDADSSSLMSLYGISEVLTVSHVPVPGASWLLGSGLIGLAGWRRKR
jgi:hypothetical protein